MGAPLSPTDPFADVELLAAYLKVEIDDSDLMAVTALDGATSLIQSYCDQMISLVEDDVTVLDGTGTDVLLLPEYPVLDVTEVTSGFDLTDPTVLVGPEGGSDSTYAWNRTGLLVKKSGDWGTAYQSIEVTYSHGYEQIPVEVQLVCVAVAARGFAQDGATQESAGSYNASYAGQPGTLTADEKRVLDRYRSRRK